MKNFRKILIVDDEPANLIALEYQLEKNDYTVIQAKDGFEALEIFKSINDISLVLLDIMMPDLDGFKVCESMTEIKPHIPVILITALEDDSYLKKGFDLGAWDYITKPWSEIQLMSRIKKALRVSDAESENINLLTNLSLELKKQNEDLKLASQIQRYILPRWVYLKKNILVTSSYSPCEQLGGDLFDIIKMKNDNYLIYIGDISGHGTQAALLMTAVKSIIRVMVENDHLTQNISHLLNSLNTFLVQQMFHERFLTILISVIDLKNNTISSISAGHPPIIKINLNNKQNELISKSGTYPLGWMQKFKSVSAETIKYNNFSKTDNLLFFTDGLYECTHNESSNFLGLESLKETINRNLKTLNSVSIPYTLHQLIEKENYDLSKDDVAIVNVQFLDNFTDIHNNVYFSFESSNHIEYLRQLKFIERKITVDILDEDLKIRIFEFIHLVLNFLINDTKQENISCVLLISLKNDIKYYQFNLWVNEYNLKEKFYEKFKSYDHIRVSYDLIYKFQHCLFSYEK